MNKCRDSDRAPPRRTTTLVACLILALLTCPAIAESFGNGVSALARGDYATAMRIFRPLADQGDRRAQYYVGSMYEYGQGVPQSSEQAVVWFRRAAEQGDVLSQDGLALAYFSGDGVPQDFAKATRWWLRAAEQGDPSAQHGLSHIYKRGAGVPQNFVLAYMWLVVAEHDPEYAPLSKRELEEIVPHMAPSQIAEAQRLAERCLQSNYKSCNRDLQTADTGNEIVQSSNRNPSSPIGVPLKMDGGVLVVPVEIDGVMTLDFTVDTGASDVSVPADVFSTLKRMGVIADIDVNGLQTHVLADGSKSQSPMFMIRSLKVGDIVIKNVRASVVPVQGSLLLGQSFLERFKKLSIDNAKRELVLELR